MLKMHVRFISPKIDMNVASYRLRAAMVASRIARRFAKVEISTSCKVTEPVDTVVLSKRYDLEALDSVAKLRDRFNTRILLDLCDNHFALSQIADPKIEERLRQLRWAISLADEVIVPAEYLASVIRTECGNNVTLRVIDDFVESPCDPTIRQMLSPSAFLFNVLKSKLSRETYALKLVWFGNYRGSFPGSGIGELVCQVDTLNKYFEKKIMLTVVSNSYRAYKEFANKANFRCHYLPWSRHTVSRAIQLHDAVIIPAAQNSFNWSKSSNRLTTALSLGVQVIASPIPSYSTFSAVAHIGTLADGLDALLRGELKPAAQVDFSHHNDLIEDRWAMAISNS